jgi:hypothetical protein
MKVGAGPVGKDAQSTFIKQFLRKIMSSITEDQSQRIRACTVARSIEDFDLLIEDMEMIFGTEWGNLTFAETLTFLKSPDAKDLDMLAVALDDAADGVSLVTRGADLFAASNIHRTLQALLGLPVPRWHHHPLLTDDAGQKLAKRRGSPSLAERRLAGVDGRMLAQQLRLQHLRLGT